MYDENNGAVCTMMELDPSDSAKSLIYTHRMSSYEWQIVVDTGFTTTQAGYFDKMNEIPLGEIKGLTG